jgi:3-methyladenine DNA glycosylase AlkD
MTQQQATQVSQALQQLSNKSVAANLSLFFKTGPGEYGEGDVFLGVKVPQARLLAKKFSKLPPIEIEKLSKSPFHEARFTAGIILLNQFKQEKDKKEQRKLFEFYLKLVDAGSINNWDLVDSTAPYFGTFLLDLPNPNMYLAKFARSKNLWKQRVSIMFLFAFIRSGFEDVAYHHIELFLNHKHDLIHKASGWMLREAGIRDRRGLNQFLEKHVSKMPRVMLRYSLEKHTHTQRKYWLSQPVG